VGDDVEEAADLRLEAMTFRSHVASHLLSRAGFGADMRKTPPRFKCPGPSNPAVVLAAYAEY
jgi:hypothetical protein